jgi:LCP family protein required for cell wall assembly
MAKVVNSNTRMDFPIRLDTEKGERLDKWKVYFSRIKRKILSHVWFARAAILTILAVVLFVIVLIAKNLFFESRLSYYYTLSKDFIFTSSDKIKMVDGKVNILVLGKGGVNHEAPDLTDTMIFISLNTKNNSLTMISLPRDIWIPELRAKLNSTYYWGNKKKPGGGIILTKSVVEEIVGQTIQYGMVIDFEGFKKIIDILGGIEVNVERSFSDYKYPIPGREVDDCGGDPELKCRYETIHFEQGRQFMDGETALKFARSRNAEGDEGTDLAREARQQKVIDAIKDKIISGKALLSPKKLSKLKAVVLEHLETDMDPSAAAILARYSFNARGSVKSYVLDQKFLVNPPKSPEYDNLYVFIPKDGDASTGSVQDWSKVQEWVKGIIE